MDASCMDGLVLAQEPNPVAQTLSPKPFCGCVGDSTKERQEGILFTTETQSDQSAEEEEWSSNPKSGDPFFFRPPCPASVRWD
jgi:hypothetical protein